MTVVLSALDSILTVNILLEVSLEGCLENGTYQAGMVLLESSGKTLGESWTIVIKT